MGTQTRAHHRKRSEGPTRAAVYCRISDARDGDTAGVDRQREDCLKLAAERGLEVVGVYIDNNKSAFSGRVRPEYERMLAEVDAGTVDVIVVWATDRMYRRLSDLEELVERINGVDVLTCRSGEVALDSADGKLHARLLGSVAQHSSEKAGERVSRAAEQRARAGRFSGGKRRFGYSKDGREVVPAEAEALRWAYRHVIEGGSVYAVVAEWTRRGLTGPSGGKLAAPAVRDYLLRPMNAGIAVYQGVEIGSTDLPVIVDESTWRAVRAILTAPERRSSVGRPAKTMLAPVLRCGVCGGRASGAGRSRGVGQARERIYMCRLGCVSRSRDRLDEAIGETVIAYLERHASDLGSAVSERASGDGLGRQAEALRVERQELEAAFARGDLDVAAYVAGMKGNAARREVLDGRASASTTGRTVRQTLGGVLDVRAAWGAADIDTRREIIREVIREIRMGPTSTPGRFDFSTIEIEWGQS